MVEFAIVVPLIFLFTFATIEFGRMIMVLHALEAAAREGCREAISWRATSEEVEEAVSRRLAGMGVSTFTLDVEPTAIGSAEQWSPITVRVTANYGALSLLPAPDFLRNVTLAGTCTLPKESDNDS